MHLYVSMSCHLCFSTSPSVHSPIGLIHQFDRQLEFRHHPPHNHTILKSQKFAHHSLVLHVGQNLGDTVNRRLQQSDFKSRECLDRYKALVRLPHTTLSKFKIQSNVKHSSHPTQQKIGTSTCSFLPRGLHRESGILRSHMRQLKRLQPMIFQPQI